MEAWTYLYKELAERIEDKLPEVKWVDLWHEQVSFLTEELPFPTPAIFIAFNTNKIDDLGKLIQECDMQVDFYLFYETFSDTYQGSFNQTSAINFLKLLTAIHTTFHGVSGANFQTMRRVDMRREDSGGAGNLYRISFSFNIIDNSAEKSFEEKTGDKVQIIKGDFARPDTTNDSPLFVLS